VGLFGGKGLATGWHSTEDPEVVRYFDGQHWKGLGRITALDDLGPIPQTAESKRQATVQELIQQQEQIEQALHAGNAAIAELGQKRALLEEQIVQLRTVEVDVEHENYLRSINVRDFPTVADGSTEIAAAIKETRTQAKQLIKNGLAVSTRGDIAEFFDANSGFDSPTRKLLRSGVMKLVLGIFNAECEAATRAMRSMDSLNTATNRIHTVVLKLHETTLPIGVTISDAYVSLKLHENRLVWEHLVAKAIERAEAQDLRERYKDEAKAQADYEIALDALEKELEHYVNMLAEMQRRQDIEGIERFRALMEETRERMADIEARAANIRVGYVYVISNIGSFGEGIVKIGLTRRLEPLDRVRELSNASVPFRYDVHAMIFSLDAVSLETKLHQHFDRQRINRINRRREFFRVTPREVLEALKAHKADVVEWIEDPEAEEYRLTRDQEQQMLGTVGL